jgi:hypothetical protein
MLRVLFLNDYPMGEARRLNAQGVYPSQHLWGAKELPQFGVEPVFFPDQTWMGAPQRWRFSVQQLQAWMMASRCDAIYSACQPNTWLLARLRSLGLLRKPLITMVHHPLQSRLQNDAYVAGHDALLFLNESVRQNTLERYGSKVRFSRTLPWGPDLSFYTPHPGVTPDVDVMAAGKTNRDFVTLIEAARGQAWRLAIYCANRNIPVGLNIPDNVSIHRNESGNVLNYRELYERSERARIIAVPLAEVDTLAGLTSVVDALALSKPLIMTRNKWLDLDPGRDGFGFTVPVGDVQAWREAIGQTLAGRERGMSEVAADVARCLNMTAYARELAHVLKDVFTQG